MGRKDAWTAEEEQFLIDNAETMGDRELAERLGRGAAAVQFHKGVMRGQGRLGYVRRPATGGKKQEPKDAPVAAPAMQVLAVNPPPQPCPPHHFLCGNAAIEGKYPGFFVGHERTTAGSGQEWNVCIKCGLVRLLEVEAALPNARRVPSVGEHYYTEEKGTSVVSSVKLPVSINTSELMLISEAAPETGPVFVGRVPSPIIDATSTFTVPSPALKLIDVPEPEPEPAEDEDEDPELEALRAERVSLLAEEDALEIELEDVRRDLVTVNLRIENHELKAELERLRSRLDAGEKRPA